MPRPDGTFRANTPSTTYDFTFEDGVLTVDGERVDYRFDRLTDGSYLLLVEGRSFLLVVEQQSGGSVLVTVSGHEIAVEVQDERALLLERFGMAGAAAAAEREVRAPMPGLVLQVNVETGQSVAEGDQLLVLEAMKMENELRAPVSGMIETLHVSAGDTVDKNDLLVEFGEDAE